MNTIKMLSDFGQVADVGRRITYLGIHLLCILFSLIFYVVNGTLEIGKVFILDDQQHRRLAESKQQTTCFRPSSTFTIPLRQPIRDEIQSLPVNRHLVRVDVDSKPTSDEVELAVEQKHFSSRWTDRIVQSGQRGAFNTKRPNSAAFVVLKGISRAFASLAVDDIETRAEILARNPDLLTARLDLFLDEAVKQLLQNNVITAVQCLQSLTILGLCKDIPDNELEEQVMAMQRNGSGLHRKYRESYIKVLEAAERIAEADKRLEAAGNEEVLDTLIDCTDIAPTKPNQSLQSIEAKQFPDREMKKLSAKYRLQDGAKFFTPGKVFALIWHESAGEQRPGANRGGPTESDERDNAANDDKLNPNMTIGPYGERIYSHIKRMVVIRNRRGYCWCVAINSYGGYGLRKPGLRSNERDAHTIIYDNSSSPVYLKNEPSISKDPISVSMVAGQTLNSASRLYYGKPFVVEWNTRVMEVGEVDAKCLPTLMADAAVELLPKSKTTLPTSNTTLHKSQISSLEDEQLLERL